jgi:hypothetical protein
MKIDKITIVVGFDQRESILYHTLCQSVIDKSSIPIQFIPLALNTMNFYQETHQDGSNKFIYSRFLTPYLCNYEGIDLFDDNFAVQVIKHEYKTKMRVKYLGNKNVDYPRKNWSSLIMFNCGHPSNKNLTPKFIQENTGSYLHRFSWLQDDQIGCLPISWNWLALEYAANDHPDLVHFTLGAPCYSDFSNCEMSEFWWSNYRKLMEGVDLKV